MHVDSWKPDQPEALMQKAVSEVMIDEKKSGVVSRDGASSGGVFQRSSASPVMKRIAEIRIAWYVLMAGPQDRAIQLLISAISARVRVPPQTRNATRDRI